MIATWMTLVLPLANSGEPTISVRLSPVPGMQIVVRNDGWYRDRELERQRELARLEEERRRDHHDHDLWEHRKPGDRWQPFPWHDRRSEWDREREERLRMEREREDARLARIRFLEAEAAQDRAERARQERCRAAENDARRSPDRPGIRPREPERPPVVLQERLPGRETGSRSISD